MSPDERRRAAGDLILSGIVDKLVDDIYAYLAKCGSAVSSGDDDE